jgi:hypothetical protein
VPDEVTAKAGFVQAEALRRFRRFHARGAKNTR